MGEREEFWVECKKSFTGASLHRYEKGEVYRGYKEGKRYYLTLPGSSRKIEIPEPGKYSAHFNLIDPFLININKVLE